MDSEEGARLFSLVDVREALSVEEADRLRQRVPDLCLERGQTLYTPRYAAVRCRPPVGVARSAA